MLFSKIDLRRSLQWGNSMGSSKTFLSSLNFIFPEQIIFFDSKVVILPIIFSWVMFKFWGLNWWIISSIFGINSLLLEMNVKIRSSRSRLRMALKEVQHISQKCASRHDNYQSYSRANIQCSRFKLPISSISKTRATIASIIVSWSIGLRIFDGRFKWK